MLAVILLFLSASVQSQEYHDFGFERSTSIPVFGSNDFPLDLAWAGGLNVCQFHKFDLNFNGVDDLIIFDRHGNRLLTFINNGSNGEYAYTFAPEYIDFFPPMVSWVQFIDFNNNGKKDIFTYTIGGIKVFRNISDTEIRFEQITFPYLRSFYGNIQTNLLVTDVDYPAILDMDGDGDLDIITFWGLGTFLEMHTNKSIELYGHADSLHYTKTEYCWGRFAESEESNTIILDTCLNLKNIDFLSRKASAHERHTGSTLLMLDMTGNGLKDLILGDIDFPGLFLLVNDGSHDAAQIVEVDTLFPSNTRPVNLFSFPVASYLDVTNNGINDLVVSPFDASLRRANHHQSAWFYRNTGTNELPVFEFEQEDIFQHRMIDVGAGSMPVLADLDNDGLADLIIGNYGFNDTCYYDQFSILRCKYVSQLAIYRNTGSVGNPAFTLVDGNFANLSELDLRAIYPAFGDLDNDGRPEMLIGNESGNLLLFKDQSGIKDQPQFELADDNFQNIGVGSFSTPQLIDMNGNGLLDLVIGQQNGRISFYENQGSLANPVFVKITDELGGVNVTDTMLSYTGYSIPHFFRDAGSKLRLFVGSESGRVFYYRDIEENLNGEFTLAEERLLLINEGIRTSPVVGFLTGSDFPDLIIGNYGGGLSFYKGTLPRPFGVDEPRSSENYGFDVFPNPASTSLTMVLAKDDFISAGLEVFDLIGRLVLKTMNLTTRNVNLQVQDWNRGLYLFKVRFITSDGSEYIAGKKVMIVK